MKLTMMLLLAAASVHAQPNPITEYAIHYPTSKSAQPACGHTTGSTHEITFNAKGGKELWITGQNYSEVVKVGLDGHMTFYPMPPNSGPHGIEFDAAGRLWVTLEFTGQIVRLDANGKIVQTIDVRLACPTCPNGKPLETHPHGMSFGTDGKTIWFTGKATGTIGRIAPDGKITTYQLPTLGSVPIYIKAAPDGSMWVTELLGNAIARITPGATVPDEFKIPTPNSRPIAIVPQPDGKAMWFSEEAGNKVAKITPDGKITEFPIPKKQANHILAGLGFDSAGSLWVQQYVDQNNPTPAGPDYVIKIDKSIVHAAAGATVPMTSYKVPTTCTIMHRIIQGPDGNMWFTELGVDRVGKVH